MLTKNIYFKNFSGKINSLKIKKDFKKSIKENIDLLNTLNINYKYNYKKSLIKKLKRFSNINIIGMGGSILGAEAIYDFLKDKIKKKVFFINNLNVNNNFSRSKKKNLNLIISKSGNTLETISNANILIKKNDKNIFITENKNSYLQNLAKKLKAEIIEHKNYIGGRYSVLSEVGMLPAELMGLQEKKFKKLNSLIKKKFFINNLTKNVSIILNLIKKDKFTSVILNYDPLSENFFRWYQQLVAESLGKNKKGIFPIVSSMPRDNHSLLQLYLDGPKKNFFTFFFVNQNNSHRLNNKQLLKSHSFLKNKNLNKISYSQFNATLKVFKNKKIPFRCFNVKKRTEETLGELFTFFILETILLGKAMAINPYDQPAVELVKRETKKFLIKS